jgi:hypothetical protein
MFVPAGKVFPKVEKPQVASLASVHLSIWMEVKHHRAKQPLGYQNRSALLSTVQPQQRHGPSSTARRLGTAAQHS